MPTITVPEGAANIIQELNAHGFEAYAVGGCVRDSLLGREPEDWDITTNARPSEVKSIFPRTIDTGIAHGTVTVMDGRTGYEITTYRIDGEYLDGRHPRSVEFTFSLIEDLKRRDFTINAMAYSDRDGLVDAFHGREDLEAGVIRCVGDAESRFTEDALRMLRALRFSAQLGFSIEEETQKAIRKLAPNLSKVSKERVAAELNKLLVSPHPERMVLLGEMKIAPYIAPGFLGAAEAQEESDLLRLSQLPPSRSLRWAAYLRRSTPEAAEAILRALKMDNATIAAVKTLVAVFPVTIVPEKPAIRRLMSTMSPALYDDAILLKANYAAPGAASAPDTASTLTAIMSLTSEIRLAGDCTAIKDLAVTGRDLIAAGISPGPRLGRILEEMFQDVLTDPCHNTKDYLMTRYIFADEI